MILSFGGKRSMLSPIDKLFHTSDFSDFLFNNLDDAMCLIDTDFHVLRANDALKKIFNSDEDIENMFFGNASKCAHFPRTNKACGAAESCAACAVYTGVAEAAGSGKKINRISVPWECTENGEKIEKYLQFTFIPLTFFEQTCILISIHDISVQEERERQIKELAGCDFLTGLADRRYFYDVCESYFRTARRGFINLAVCMIDIDSFRAVNDTYGHKAGDLMLKELASVMEKNIRQSDFISRYGGDEFCLIFQYRKKADVLSAAEKLRGQIETHEFVYKTKALRITISIGATVRPGHSTDALVGRAGRLLLAAKEKGGNRVEVDG